MHLDLFLTSFAFTVSAGFLHSVSIIAQNAPVNVVPTDLSIYLSAFEKLGVVGGACVCCFFLYKAVSRKDDQLQETHKKHLEDLAISYKERVEDLKSQIEHLKSLIK